MQSEYRGFLLKKFTDSDGVRNLKVAVFEGDMDGIFMRKVMMLTTKDQVNEKKGELISFKSTHPIFRVVEDSEVTMCSPPKMNLTVIRKHQILQFEMKNYYINDCQFFGNRTIVHSLFGCMYITTPENLKAGRYYDITFKLKVNDNKNRFRLNINKATEVSCQN